MTSNPSYGLIGAVLQDSYRLERKIGEGGMGAVFEASHLRVRRRFAVKVLSPDVARNEEGFARFKREAEVTSELGHPNIIEVIDFNTTADGAPYMVMELLEGEGLDQRLLRERNLELSLVASILSQTCSALHAAHERGIIHRDLKPPNIFLCRRGGSPNFVKVLDFGISKVLGSSTVQTGAHTIMGTPSYMAPEQAEGRNADVTLRTDVFAMGVILYEMLTGITAFGGETLPAVLYQVVHQDPRPLSALRPDLPPGVVEVVARAMRKRPEERYASADELARCFHEALQGQPSSAQGAGPAVVIPPTVRADLTPAPPMVAGPAAPATRQAMAPAEPEPALRVAPPTTLSASVGEMEISGRRRPLPVLGLGVAGLVAVLLGGGLYLGLRSGGSTAESPATTGNRLARSTTPDGGVALSAAARRARAALWATAARDASAPAPAIKLVPASKVFPSLRPILRPTPTPTPKPEAKTPLRRIDTKGLRPVVSVPKLPGKLRIIARDTGTNQSVPGTLFVDRRPAGEVPMAELSVRPGLHVIEIRKPGYAVGFKTVVVAPGGSQLIVIPLTRQR